MGSPLPLLLQKPRALSHSFALLRKSETHLPSFQSFPHSLLKTSGVYPNCSLSRSLLPRDHNGNRPSRSYFRLMTSVSHLKLKTYNL